MLFLAFTNLKTFSQEIKEIKYNDLIVAEKRPSAKYTTYVSKDGAVYNVGDRLKIGKPYENNKEFTYIQSVGLGVVQTPAKHAGTEAEIKYFFVWGSKRSGFFVMVRAKASTAVENYHIQLETAIETGEIKSFGMTSDEALSELKKAKDKLDLGLINQASYDSLKIELTKYIK